MPESHCLLRMGVDGTIARGHHLRSEAPGRCSGAHPDGLERVVWCPRTHEKVSAMPRYTFHWTGGDRSPDAHWSLNLPDLAAAQRWAETETYNLSSVRRLADLMEST